MSLEEAIFTRTTTFGDLPALIGQRVYPNILPDDEDVTLPAVRYIIVSDPQFALTHELGPSGLARPRVQFDVYAHTPEEAKLVGEQIRLAWEGFRGVVGSTSIYASIKADHRSGYEQETNLHREQYDFLIWWPEATS